MIKNKVESPVIDDSWIAVAIETVVKRNNVNSLNDVDRIRVQSFCVDENNAIDA